MGKGKFLYVTGENYDHIVVKDSAYKYNPDHDHAFALSKFSTDELLKLKAQLATEIENRMDLDEVNEENLRKMRELASNADARSVAAVIRQTLDRIDLVNADLKRAKARLELLTDEMKSRMINDGTSELKFQGLVSISQRPKTVYGVGEEGWQPVYDFIVDEALKLREAGKPIEEAFAILQKRLTSTTLNDLVDQGERIPDCIKVTTLNDISIKRIK